MTEERPAYVVTPKPIAPPCTDAERRRKALETLRRNLYSAAKQVEHLLAMETREDDDAPQRSHRIA